MTKAKYIRIASDLHIESQFGRAMSKIEEDFLPKDERDSSSIMVLAGDISSSPQQLFEFLRLIEGRFANLIFVPGNHEHYHHNMNQWVSDVDTLFANLERTYWSTLGVESVELGGVYFIFSTLWGDGGKNPLEELYVQNGLADFQLIRYNGRSFTVADMKDMNNSNKSGIEELLSLSHKFPVVVVTHHLPSYQLCHPRFGNSINGGFASDCDYMMSGGHPALWIHGHTHDTIDRDLYGTRIVANPYGYRYEHKATQFNTYEAKFVEISTLTK